MFEEWLLNASWGQRIQYDNEEWIILKELSPSFYLAIKSEGTFPSMVYLIKK
jgi:hypothetical protein